MITLHIVDIVKSTTVDGVGWRTSIYCSGCHHYCIGCHNPETWPISAGVMRSIDDIFKEIKSTGLDVTFSGGDPLYQPYGFAKLAEKIKKELGRNIWCYTGFRYEQLKNIVFADQLLKYIDVLVDGPFIQDMKSDNLLFRGSSNQRLIDVPKSLESGRVVLYEYDPYPRFY